MRAEWIPMRDTIHEAFEVREDKVWFSRKNPPGRGENTENSLQTHPPMREREHVVDRSTEHCCASCQAKVRRRRRERRN